MVSFVSTAAQAAEMPIWTVLPFALLLLSIAIMPLFAPHWWHLNRNKAALALLFGVPSALIVLFHDAHALVHTSLEYLAFLSLLGSLFAISGGVRVAGSLAGTPLANTGMLALGAVLASVIGTTGASMLLIRPYLRANQARSSRVHLVVFFIFIVSNCGGLLTPLGDPPLFLGFLRGVPFQWTLRLWKPWLAAVGLLLVVFNVFDQIRFHREDIQSPEDLDEKVELHDPIRIEGGLNILLLLGVVGVALISGLFIHPRWGEKVGLILQSLLMGALAALSVKLTPKRIREENEFSWHPFIEVAYVFAAIFVAMIPALSLLKTRGASLGVSESWQFFWATGALSAVLDNAPTYLAFLSAAQHLPDEVVGTTHAALSAISCGAVFFGALTYIGNGPNFMVKAIAEHAGVRMPLFLAYCAWSVPILIPVFGVLTLLFFR